jgi:uncharacterized membrane protein YgcG
LKKFLFLSLFVFSVEAAERVWDFHAAIQVAADGTLSVTERIVVQAEGREIRRGILRDIPTEYRDRLGNKVRSPIEVWRVTRNGEPESFHVEPLANGIRIRIGRAEVLLRPGNHTYEIHYRTARVVGFFKEHDELYWNVNGNGWVFSFDSLSAEVALPSRVPARDIKAEAYTGEFGARGRDYQAFTTEGSAAFRATRPMLPGQGMTIVVSFPKGVVTQPAFATLAREFLDDNRGILSGLAAWLALVAFLGWRWWLVGRDPREGPKFPRYEPPPGIGPAGVRYVDKMYWDSRCVSAMLLGLGARGYLRITEEPGSFTVDRTGKDVDWFIGEKKLVEFLRGPGKPTTISRSHSLGLQTAAGAAALEVEHYFGARMFSTNRGSLGVGFVLGLLGAGSMLVNGAPVFAGIVLAALMAGSLFFFARILPAYTVEGRKLQDAIEGLRQYLSVAEKDELARMKAPPQTQAEFAKLLPYAVALNVEKTWADRFTGILGAAAVAAAAEGFYSMSSGSGLERDLGDSLGRAVDDLNDTVSAASTPPGSTSGSSGGSSGGGGGGSSGGGGGGGGGSGW